LEVTRASPQSGISLQKKKKNRSAGITSPNIVCKGTLDIRRQKTVLASPKHKLKYCHSPVRVPSHPQRKKKKMTFFTDESFGFIKTQEDLPPKPR